MAALLATLFHLSALQHVLFGVFFAIQ